MAGLVVKSLVFPQHFQQGDASGGEQAVGADDDQDHRQEVKGHGQGGVLGGDGDEVAGAQAQCPHSGQQPAGAGLTLAHASAMKQLDGIGHPHPEQVERQGQGQQHAEKGRRLDHGGQGEGGVEGDGELQQGGQRGGGQLVEGHAQGQPAPDAQNGGVQALPALDEGDVPLAHAQDVVEAQLFFSLLHQKAVDVQQQNGGQDARHEHADLHHHHHIGEAPHVQHAGVGAQGGHDVKGGGEPCQGQQVRDKEPAVLAHPLGGQPGIQSVTQGAHPRRSAG